MITRNTQKQKNVEGQPQGQNERDEPENMDDTLTEINPTEENQRDLCLIPQDQLSALLASINTLKESVNEMRKENEDLRREFRKCDRNAIVFEHNPTNRINVNNVSSEVEQNNHAAAVVNRNLTNHPADNTMSMRALVQPTPSPFSSTLPATMPQCTPPSQTQPPLFTSTLLTAMPQYTPSSQTQSLPNTVLPTPYLPQQPGTATSYISPSSDNLAAKLYPLPDFDGNPEDWPLFKTSFVDSTNEFKYTNRQNLMRLQRAIQGNAKKAVSSMLIYPDNVPLVIDELEFIFGRPEVLIKVQMQKIQQFPVIYEGRHELLIEFSNQVRNIVAFFKAANCEHHLINPMLLEQLVLKLPLSKQFDWSHHVSNMQSHQVDLNVFANWLNSIAKVVSRIPSGSPAIQRHYQQQSNIRPAMYQSTNRPSSANVNVPRRVLHNTESNSNQQVEQQSMSFCPKCKQNHKLNLCQQFKALSVHNRWEFVKTNHLCFNCLQRGHSLQQCRQKRTCGINECNRMHNQLLHQHNNQLSSPLRASPSAPPQQDATLTQVPAAVMPINNGERIFNCRDDKTNFCLFKIVPVILFGPQASVKMYAMIDEGSSVTLLEESIANQLGAKGRMVPLTLQWYNQEQYTEESRVVNVEIRGENMNTTFQLKNVHTVKQLDLPIQSFNNIYDHLRGLPINSYTTIKPSLLIGLDNSHLSTVKQTISAELDSPIAVATNLGWVVYGSTRPEASPIARVVHVRKSIAMQQIHDLVQEYFSVESLGVKPTDMKLESNTDSRARQILQTTTKNIGRRYEVGLLWHEDNVNLPPSYEMAKRRLLNTENKMLSDEAYAVRYKEEIQKYIDKGYATLLTDEEAQRHSPTTWYLPHFGVANPNKPNKLRIVFDAAAATSNVSLNSVLLKGPEHAQPLIAIIHQFRQRQIAVAGDIQEMFSQIKVRRGDRDAQRFLWRDGNRSNNIRTYTMTSMIFGAACSPCCAEYVKNVNAAQFRDTMPRGAKAVSKSTYVDDLVICFDTVQEAFEVVNEAITINAAAGFKLRNFVSNHKPLQHQLNNNNEAELPNVLNMEHQQKTDKILGMYWNSKDDVLEFHFKFYKIPTEVINCKYAPTKRELLSLAMAIYDPFGLLANVTIAVKLLLQDTWKKGVNWDERLPKQLEQQWIKWWSAFQSIENFTIPRCYSSYYSTAEDLQLHIFVDASDAAYAAVVYLRIKHDNHIDVAFITAKSRCAPKKEVSVPRLELQAAILGSRLKTSVEEWLDRKVNNTTFWSDSQTVLLWIRSTKRDFKQFVAFRIAEILHNTVPSQWRWLPSAVNVADEATRFNPTLICQNSSRWITGPSFLSHDEEEWPKEPYQLHSDHYATEECKKKLLIIDSNKRTQIFDISKYSSYMKLIRVFAWVTRFINNLKPTLRRQGELKPHELQAAENYICREAQQECYHREINTLQSNNSITKSSQLFRLTPKLDKNNVLRVNGRIDAAYCLPESARQPIIIPRKHRLAELIMDYYHRKNHHQNSSLTINEMRQRFWIPHPQSLLYTIQRKCPTCVRHRAKPSTPLMGQLPQDRLTPYVRPFSYTGVDYCGPFFVAIGRRQEKRWIALFTCLTTRAIHLEVSTNLSSDAFILCLKNFINRRGVPVRMRSDNGTNFIGAQCKLKKEDRLLDFDAIQRETAKDGIEWIFNCPGNPSAGGCWERLVQCVKRILQRVLKEEAPRLDTFNSVVIEAENIVNSRPLTDLPVSPEHPEPLTPNHFLLGCLNSTQTPSNAKEKICLQKQWRIAQNLKDRLWKQWIKEYLPRLLTRPKWHTEAKPLKPNQLVIICDASLPRSQWQIGRIVDVIIANDGQVRSASIQTSHGIIRRPATKLAALEFVNTCEDSPGGGM